MTDRTTVDDLDEDRTLFHTGRGAGHNTVAHTDRKCPQLRNSDPIAAKARVLSNDRLICLNCLGENRVDDSPNPRATRRRLEEMAPEDLGLSPLGDRSGGSA